MSSAPALFNENASIYSRLDGNGEFRVLVLEQSSSFSDDIIINLVNVRLKDRPSYEALSYYWGTGLGTGNVILNGQAVRVTKNLEIALRYLRLKEGSRRLWIDALCINQEDLEERNSQVRLMREIYSDCSRDLMWLGERDVDRPLKAMIELGTITEALNNQNSGRLRPGDSQKMSSILGFFSESEAWHRAWIMQEISVAPCVLLMAGYVTLSWSQVEKFLDTDAFIRRYGIPDVYHGTWSHGVPLSEKLKNKLAVPQLLAHQRRLSRREPEDCAGSPGSSLKDVLARFRYTLSTDPRDKIHSFLGLTSNALGITPNYERNVRDTYTEVSRRIIEYDGNLDLICQGPWSLNHRKRRRSYRSPSSLDDLPSSRLDTFPSWVPDFIDPGNAPIMFAQRDIFDAGRRWTRSPFSTMNGDTLVLEGILLDRIKEARYSFSLWGCGLERSFGLMPNTLLREAISDGNGSLNQLLNGSSLPKLESWDFLIIKPPKELEDSGSNPSQDHHRQNGPSRNPSFEDYWRTLLLDCGRFEGMLRRLQPDDIEKFHAQFEGARTTPIEKWGESMLDDSIEKELIRNLDNWLFAMTESGIPCMAAKSARVGDLVVLLKGAKVPIVLQRRNSESESDESFVWMGPCYAHGHMDGKAFDKENVSQVTREFVIR